jgi:K+-transporting ATPase KdpF subunit
MRFSYWSPWRSFCLPSATYDSAIGFAEGGIVMNLESILMLAVSVLLMVYLLYALLMPEKF